MMTRPDGGRLMLDEWGATYWSYDLLGRPIAATTRAAPSSTTPTMRRGQRTELTVLGQGTVYYRYNEVGRMVSVLDGKTDMETTYEYDPAGRVSVQAHPNGATTYFSYDLSGRSSEKVTVKNADASVLVRFAYTRDAAGNPIAIERESGLGVYYYEYDALQRLAYEGQFVDAVRQYENYYEYDAAGNRTLLRHGETGAGNLTYYDYNAANELLTAHDGRLDLLRLRPERQHRAEQHPSYTRYYAWDGRDMMVGVSSAEAGWTDNVYRYDGMGGRVSTLESMGLTYFDWDGINVIQEKDSTTRSRTGRCTVRADSQCRRHCADGQGRGGIRAHRRTVGAPSGTWPIPAPPWLTPMPMTHSGSAVGSRRPSPTATASGPSGLMRTPVSTTSSPGNTGHLLVAFSPAILSGWPSVCHSRGAPDDFSARTPWCPRSGSANTPMPTLVRLHGLTLWAVGRGNALPEDLSVSDIGGTLWQMRKTDC